MNRDAGDCFAPRGSGGMHARDGRAAHSAFAGGRTRVSVLGVISLHRICASSRFSRRIMRSRQLEQYIAPGPQALERPFTQWGRVHGETRSRRRWLLAGRFSVRHGRGCARDFQIRLGRLVNHAVRLGPIAVVDDHLVCLGPVHGAVAVTMAPAVVVFTKHIVSMGVWIGGALQNGE